MASLKDKIVVLTGASRGIGATVLILGDSPASLGVTRSLGQIGHRTIVGTSNLSCYANLSRYCSETWYHPPIRESAPAFFEELKRFLKTRPDITIIFPTEDIYLLELSENQDRFLDSIKFVMPSRDHIRLCDDKLAMHKLIDELRIPQAAYAVSRGKEELFEKCDKVGYPCVLLHADSHGLYLGKKAIIIRSFQHLEQIFENREPSKKPVLIRSYARGTIHFTTFVASEGRILDSIQTNATGTDRYDGTGHGVEGRTLAILPEMRQHIEKLLRHINYTGCGTAQFIVDETKQTMVFLEINPRLGAHCALARLTGIDLVRIAFELTDGTLQPEAISQSSYRANMQHSWFGGSLKGVRHEWRASKINLLQAIRWYVRSINMALRADAHICWRWDDPIPGIFGLCPNVLFSIRKRLNNRAKTILSASD